MFERRLAVLLAILLLFFSGTAVVFGTWFSNDLHVESALCRYLLVCSNDLAQHAATIELWDPEASDRAKLAGFQESLRRSLHSAARWCDLGDAYLGVGLPNQAKYCFEQGTKRAPNAPAILLRAGNFFYAAEDLPRSLNCFSRVLELVRAYDAVIFSQYQRMGVPVTEVLSLGLPGTAETTRAYLLYLLDKGLVHAAAEVWDWMETRSMLEKKLLARFVQLLLQEGKYDKAKKVQLRFSTLTERRPPLDELMFNSGFESAFLGTSLDWSLRKSGAAQARRDSEVFFEGGWALRITFDGTTNLSYDHVAQVVVVRPGRHRLTARVRTQDITTDQGVKLRVVDTKRRAALDVSTKAVLGTADWATLETEFAVPRETRLVRISVSRQKSRKLDNKIAGTVWLDDVSLIRK